MTDPVQLDTLRKVLARVFPMQGVIVVGVGRGQGLADFRSASSLLVIDARAECLEALQKQSSDGPYCTAVQAVVAAQTGAAAFHVASKPDESGLIAPEALQSLWRNLTTRTTDEVEASTLPDLVARLELAADFRCNWLVVDCLPALPMLEGAGQLIDDVEVVELRCVRDEDIAPGQGASLGSAKDWLEPLGFRLVQESEESHPQLVKALFCRDLRKLGGRVGLLRQTVAELQANNDEKARVHATEKAALLVERDDLAKEKQTLTVARDALTKDRAARTAERDGLAQAKAAADQLAAERQTQLEALTAERKQLTAARDKLAHENAALTTERDALIKERQSFLSERALLANLDARVKQQADDLGSLRKFTDASVKKHVTNAAKQIEATLGLQSYFATGELLDVNTENQAWPISPDFAFYLVELIELNDYDLIIEFGSGFSTSLVARVLGRGATKRSDRAPVGFVSFEHLEAYYAQTLGRLRQAGLAELVQLTLAPLDEWHDSDGATQPYYTCESKLADLAKRHSPAGLRVLVVVDGPPGNTAPQARYPAAPMVLRYFSGAKIDFLLDDYVRADEKELAKRWQAEIAAAGFEHVSTVRKLEKDACLIQVNSASRDASE